MSLTPEEQTALNNLRQMRADSNDHDGGYQDTIHGRRQSAIDHCVAADIALREHPADDTCELSRQELLYLVKWIDNKLDQCDFQRCPNHGLKGNIQGSMHCVVADSQAYHRFVKLQKVANQQLDLAKHITAIREEMGLAACDADRRELERRDAARYRALRELYWTDGDGTLVVLRHGPWMLGRQTYSGELLDKAIDEMMAEKTI